MLWRLEEENKLRRRKLLVLFSLWKVIGVGVELVWGLLVILGNEDGSGEGKSLFGFSLRENGEESGDLGYKFFREVLFKRGEKLDSSW